MHYQVRQKCPDLGGMGTVWGQLYKDWDRTLPFLKGVRKRKSCKYHVG